jgi:hypothetical protein
MALNEKRVRKVKGVSLTPAGFTYEDVQKCFPEYGTNYVVQVDSRVL